MHLHKTFQNNLPALTLRNLLNAWTNFTWRKFWLQFQFQFQFQNLLLLHHLYNTMANNGNLQTKTKSITVFYKRRLKCEQTVKNKCKHTFQSKPQNLSMMTQKFLVHLLLPLRTSHSLSLQTHPPRSHF